MKRLLFVVTCIVFLLVSCNDDASGELTSQNLSSEEKDKREVTIVFDQNSNLVESIVNVEENRIVFKKNSELNLNGKEYLAAGQLSSAPNGFLRKITSISEEGDKIIVETEMAEVTDLMPEGNLDVIYNYDNMDLKRPLRTDKGDLVSYNTTMAKGANLGTFTISLNRVIFDADGNHSTTHDQIKANGSFSVQPSLDFGVRFHWWQLQEFRTIITSKKTANLDLIWSHSIPLFKHSIPLAKIPLPPVTFWIGWVPVVITNSVNVTLDANGSVNASISTGVEGTVTLKEGIRYNRGSGWNYIHDAYDFGFRFKPISATVGFDASVALNGEFETMFYGVLGVGIGANAGFYVNGTYYIDTDLVSYIDWFAGFRAGMQAFARAGLFGIPGLNFTWGYPIWSQSWPITEGQIML